MARVSEDVLQPEGFKPSTGFKHRREVGGMKQVLTFFAFLRATYLHRRHHLVLRVDLYFPEFEDLVREMLRDDRRAELRASHRCDEVGVRRGRVDVGLRL